MCLVVKFFLTSAYKFLNREIFTGIGGILFFAVKILLLCFNFSKLGIYSSVCVKIHPFVLKIYPSLFKFSRLCSNFSRLCSNSPVSVQIFRVSVQILLSLFKIFRLCSNLPPLFIGFYAENNYEPGC